MGPKFNVFSKLKKMNNNQQEEDIIKLKIKDEISAVYLYGLNPESSYQCLGKKLNFHTENKADYEQFTEHLCKIAGFINKEEFLSTEGPLFFEELIRSENENVTFGPVISKKLFHDFKENFIFAKKHFLEEEIEEKYFQYYIALFKCLEMAKENGIFIKY